MLNDFLSIFGFSSEVFDSWSLPLQEFSIAILLVFVFYLCSMFFYLIYKLLKGGK